MTLIQTIKNLLKRACCRRKDRFPQANTELEYIA
jgi:hypothetical protein